MHLLPDASGTIPRKTSPALGSDLGQPPLPSEPLLRDEVGALGLAFEGAQLPVARLW